MRRMLILGSEGFIGSHLVKHFQDRSWEVTGVDQPVSSRHAISYHTCDLTREHSSWELYGSGFDACVNAAGNGEVQRAVSDPMYDYRTNAWLPFQLLEWIRVNHPACRLIQLSSAAVYGNPETLPVSESASIHPVSPYGWHKYMSEIMCREYFELYGIRSAVIRPFSVYGPGLRKQLLWDLAQKVYAVRGNPVELWGTGRETRDFIHVSDLVYAIELLLDQAPLQAETYNVASGAEHTISDVAAMMLPLLEQHSDVRFNGQERPGNPIHWRADISRIRALGFEPRWSLPEGLAQYAAWLKSETKISS